MCLLLGIFYFLPDLREKTRHVSFLVESNPAIFVKHPKLLLLRGNISQAEPTRKEKVVLIPVREQNKGLQHQNYRTIL